MARRREQCKTPTVLILTAVVLAFPLTVARAEPAAPGVALAVYKSSIAVVARQVNVAVAPAPLPTPVNLTPVAPVLVSPQNGERLSTVAPLLTVNNSNLGRSGQVRLELSRRPDFATVEWRFVPSYFQGVNSSEWGRNCLEGTTYYWRAQSTTDGTVWGPWSGVWSFLTASGGAVAATPTLLSPPNGSTVSTLQPTFRWAAVPGATLYRLKFGDMALRLAQTQFVPPMKLGAGETVAWQVSARNAYGWGAPSAEWTIITPAAAPPEGQQVTRGSPALVWHRHNGWSWRAP